MRPDDPAPDSASARLAAARAEFSPKLTYLTTASVGLPPQRSLDVGVAALTADDLAETVRWVSAHPPHVNVIELMPVAQSFGPLAVHRERADPQR